VRPLAGVIRQQGIDLVHQGEKILANLQDVHDLIEMMAREMARQLKRQATGTETPEESEL